jgi:hypothetical protein
MSSNTNYKSLTEAREFIHSVPNANDAWRLARFIDEVKAQERSKWLPLWEAVKELEKVDDFWSDRPALINPNISSFSEKTFDNLNVHQQQQVTMARREIHRVLMELRSRGEK